MFLQGKIQRILKRTGPVKGGGTVLTGVTDAFAGMVFAEFMVPEAADLAAAPLIHGHVFHLE